MADLGAGVISAIDIQKANLMVTSNVVPTSGEIIKYQLAATAQQLQLKVIPIVIPTSGKISGVNERPQTNRFKSR